MLQQQKAHVTICNTLGLQGYNTIDMTLWKRELADRWDALPRDIRIAVIGKYTNLSDAYLSVIKALQHACLAVRRRLTLTWVEAGELEAEVRPCPRCGRGYRCMRCRTASSVLNTDGVVCSRRPRAQIAADSQPSANRLDRDAAKMAAA